MLSLHVCVGASLLANGLWELRVKAVDKSLCLFELVALEKVVYTTSGPTGVNGGGIVCLNETVAIKAGYGSRLRIGDSVVSVWPHRRDHGVEAVKFGIDAPKEVRFSRPAQHGSSPAAKTTLSVVSE